MEQMFFGAQLASHFGRGDNCLIALVFFLRVSGRRTLSKMNALDLLVTIAMGSTLATVLLTK